MLNIQLSVLQALEKQEWITTTQVAEQSRIHKQAAKNVLCDLNIDGIVEIRELAETSQSGFSSVEWRCREGSLATYMQQLMPAY